MTTQPTNLPVPSESPRDLKFNAGKIDEFVTSYAHEYIDRFGVKHRTIAGINYDANKAILNYGYITKDSFEDGNTLSVANECLRWKSNGEYYRWDGAFPKVVPPGSTPDSAGGIGKGKWVGVGDAALRSDLSKDDGASLIGWKDNTVGEALDKVGVRSLITPCVEAKINLHFGSMHGNPYRQNELGGTIQFSVASQVEKGSYQITLASTSGLGSNHTIVYLCADGTYKTNVILSIAGAVINLKKPLQETVNVGPNLWNFWSDRAHPNTYGFYAIADDAIEQLKYVGEVEYTLLPSELKPLSTNSTITLLNGDDPEAPGCVDVQYAHVTSVNAADDTGVVSPPISLTAGMYKITGVVNSSVNADIEELTVAVFQSRPTGQIGNDISQQVATARIRVKDCLTYFEISFYAQDNFYHTLEFRPSNSGTFEIGKCECVKLSANILSLNSGKHVLYGDSWINRGDIYNRLVQRLPGAEIIKKGNSGWASDQLYADFDNQVTPEQPDFVWLMCGTNDYFRNYSVDKFSFEMGRIKQKIFDLKAHCIGWDPSVGSNDDPDTTLSHNLTRSRQYALVTSYRKSNSKFNGEPIRKVRDTINISESLAAGEEVLVGVLATTENDVDIAYSAFENKSGTVDVKVGFSNIVATPTAGTVTWKENVLKRPRDNLVIKRSPGAGSFCVVMLKNNSSTALKIHGTIIAEYYPTK